MSQLAEHFFDCPYCGERISMLLDLSIGAQEYVEDCEVCCRPININYRATDRAVEHFESHSSDET
ncbi:MAG: CPXCG motif-containing cysteine-rich protein [Pseudomonadota bacterium]